MVVIILFLNDELFLLKDLEKEFPTNCPRLKYYIDFQVSALQWRIFKSIAFALKQTMLLYLMKRLEVLVPRVLAYCPLWPGWDLCDLAFLSAGRGLLREGWEEDASQSPVLRGV